MFHHLMELNFYAPLVFITFQFQSSNKSTLNKINRSRQLKLCSRHKRMPMPLSGFTAAGFNAPYLIPLALIILIADKSERSIKQAR